MKTFFLNGIGCLLIALGLGCSPDYIEGERNVPDYPVAQISPIPVDILVIEETQSPTGSHSLDKQHRVIDCNISAADPVQLEGAPNFPYYSEGRTHVCIGEVNTPSRPSMCRQVRAFELRAKSITQCFIAAKKELNRQGMTYVGPTWPEIALPMLPAAWSITNAEIQKLTGALSKDILRLMTGDDEALELHADPVCFFQDSDVTPEQAKDLAFREIQDVTSCIDLRLDALLSALKRGVNAKITSDLTLKLAIVINEKKPLIDENKACTFRAAW
jgi:hypothetical protein